MSDFVIRRGLQYALAKQAVFAMQVALSMGVIFWAFLAASAEDLRRPIRMQLLTLAIGGVMLLRFAAEKSRVWL